MAAVADTLMRQQVLVQRLASGEERKFDAFLREIDREIRRRLAGPELTEFARARLESLLAAVDDMLAGVFREYSGQLLLDLQDFAQHEAGVTARALGAAVANFEAIVPALVQIRAAVLTNPLGVKGPDGGKLLEGFIRDWTVAERKAVTGAIRQGVFEGQTNAQIVRRIRGTRARRYADGVLETTARHAHAVVRTAVQHVATAARQETFKANVDIIERVVWISTLDLRTCVLCASLDQREFPIDKGPRPPAHPQCRCAVAPRLADEFAFLDEGAKRPAVGPKGGGQVAAGLSYFEWLKKQPRAFVEEAIGKARAKLLLDGGLSAGRFAAMNVDKNFLPLTLEGMKRLEPLAFKRTGL